MHTFLEVLQHPSVLQRKKPTPFITTQFSKKEQHAEGFSSKVTPDKFAPLFPNQLK